MALDAHTLDEENAAGQGLDRLDADLPGGHEQLFERLGFIASGEQRRFLRVLTAEQNQLLLRRLRALVAFKEGLAPSGAAAMSGMGRSNFFRLKKSWSEKPDLRELAGVAGRRVRGPGFGPAQKRARRLATKLAADRDIADMTVGAIVEHVRSKMKERISVASLENIAREIRQDVRNEPRRLIDNYGRRILIDISAVSLVARREEGSEPQLLGLALVIEEWSGLILAAEPTFLNESVEAQLSSVQQAIRLISAEKLEPVAAEATDVRAVIGLASSRSDEALAYLLVSNLGPNRAVRHGARRFARLTMETIGPSLGRVKIIPQSTSTGKATAAAVRTLGRSVTDLATASDLVQLSVDEHNRPVLKRLRDAGAVSKRLPGHRSPMKAALQAAITVPRPGKGEKIIA
ncbi:hypothetical protein NF699_08180 [Sphingomonadaceae bacterium OTU29LAMAA1]|nr:hypothetical protein NF699_08180 [Sphingomonadaceae bacterium OTU29LAMAA1]